MERPGLDVYLGSPTEIVATMSAVARDELDAGELLFNDDLSRADGLAAPCHGGRRRRARRDRRLDGPGDLREDRAPGPRPASSPPLRTVHADAHRHERCAAGGAHIFKDRRSLKIPDDDLAAFPTR